MAGIVWVSLEAKLNLARFGTTKSILEQPRMGNQVLARVRVGEMPPPGKGRSGDRAAGAVRRLDRQNAAARGLRRWDLAGAWAR